jgi:5-oxoprolinase (ATP-hydrolysing)
VREPLSKWRFAADRGGTFTDLVALDPEGSFHILKLLSESPDYKDAAIEGIRRMLGLSASEPLPEDKIGGIRLGTTIATNALLERKGGKVALFITRGFADLLDIGYQDRPHIFKLCIRKSPPLYATVIEVDERIDSHGRVIRELNSRKLTHDLAALINAGFDALVVVLMHSWKNPAHELLCEKTAKKLGFTDILISHKTANLIKIVSRGQSTIIDAYLGPVLSEYVGQIRKETGNIPVEFMQSSGVLSTPLTFTGKSALLSGPAGGVRAAVRIAEDTGRGKVIGFDMGGTSTDVSRFEGEFGRIYEKVIGGIPFQTEMLDIVTVAAGGGSILYFDGQKMTVGPESAGSNPGPACYGFGGPLTLTDANLLTGRLIPAYFPKTFGPERNAPLDRRTVEEKFLFLTREIDTALGASFTPHEVAAGFIRVANEKMAMSIKEISVARGFDVRDYTLVCFGGAGGQHACPLASILDVDTILIHPLGSVMSAYGIGISQPAWKTSKTVLMRYSNDVHDGLEDTFRGMEERLTGKELASSDGAVSKYQAKKEVDLRPEGADTFLTTRYTTFRDTVETFQKNYRRLFGFSPPDAEIELVNLRLEIQASAEFFGSYKEKHVAGKTAPGPLSHQKVLYGKRFEEAPVYLRQALPPHERIKGPAFIVDSNSTVVIDPDFEGEIDETGIIIVKRLRQKSNSAVTSTGKCDPILLEIFNNFFMGVATEMGITLRNTAHSVSIKERLDFSCAVFDAKGDLVANAPHIPVHLGSMSDAVKALIRDNLALMKPGDLYLTNNPYRGGSHLPDMTVICPVFSEQGKLIFFAASRGHHADVGGITPGSMPASASSIDEEGVLVDNLILVRDGIFREDAVREAFGNHAFPVRNIPERISDLRAQTAACHKGMIELLRVVRIYGSGTVSAYMRYIQENAEYSVKKALYRFIGDGRFHSAFEDHLDDGSPIKVMLTVEGGPNPPDTLKAVIDFTGTGPQHSTDNLNAPFSVTRSAVIYVLRSLMDEDIPLNSGCLRPVTIVIPEGTLLNPFYPAAVASGNVETSQRIVDVLLGAFGIAGASQGTMNNVLFEVEGESSYYETISGGAGAVDGCPGASGVQVHMTNTRITDPEILEFRHPGIRLERFCLRKNSGGRGKFSGGDGVIREIRFLKPATVSVLSERRVYAPYGAKGADPGKRGRNLYKKADGRTTVLGHRETFRADGGDSIIIETPGGGGYGS